MKLITMKLYQKVLSLLVLPVLLLSCGGSDKPENGSDPGSGGGSGTEPQPTLTTKVTDHTTEVLQALKTAGIDVKWIQIGNETRSGILWDAGKIAWNGTSWTDASGKSYVQLSNAGYDAAKKIYPSAKIIVHLNNAFDSGNAGWFDNFKKFGGKFDMIGLSHYPMSESDWAACNTNAITQIQALVNRFNCDVMITEIGVKKAQLETAKQCIEAFMTAARGISRCVGAFYWEPEVDGVWKPAKYSSLGWNAYDMGAFGTDGKPTAILDCFKSVRDGWANGADVSWVTEMEKDGKSFKDADGKTKDLFVLLKECEMQAVRLRVWVGPDGGWCNQDDTVAKAKRAKAAGLDVMIDFHYSDFFADPGRQTLPAAWKNLSL